MKKLLFLVLALVPSLSLRSQEADSDNYTEFSVISRLEANPTFSTAGNGTDFDLGNSSIYALFEGQKNNLSWTVATHFLQAGGDYGWPYSCLGYSNSTNFLDFLTASYSIGQFSFSLGKDLVKTGGIEFDEWDWDVHTAFASPLWNGLSCYQWGGSVAWNLGENTSFALQATTSPFGERPFKSGLYAYSFQWKGDYKRLSFAWSASAFGTPDSKYNHLICLGQTLHINDALDLTFDWNNNYGVEETGLIAGQTYKGRLTYAINDKLEMGAYLLYSKDREKLFNEIFTKGITFHYCPLEDLRLHAIAAYDSSLDTIIVNLGARYYLRLIK